MFINGIYFQEYAKLEYVRMLWRNPAARERLLRRWCDPRLHRIMDAETGLG